MAASTLISNIPAERSNLKKTDGKQRLKDVAPVQVNAKFPQILMLKWLERALNVLQNFRPHGRPPPTKSRQMRKPLMVKTETSIATDTYFPNLSIRGLVIRTIMPEVIQKECLVL